MRRLGPFAVVRDHMGERRWSRNFDTLERAIECFAKTTNSMGPPESADSVLSYWYEYGAHGERVAVVQRADYLKAAMRKVSSCSAITLMTEHTVDLLDTHDGDAQEVAELPSAAEQQVKGKCPLDQDEDALDTEEEQEDEAGQGGGNKDEAGERDPSGW
jgi:hypothetical protein